jgi:hypothetical protein
MKRIIFLLSIVATILLTSCGKNDNFKLHNRVGEKLQDGVIFYVSDDGKYALICSFTDLQERRTGGIWDLGAYSWSDFDRDTLLQKDTVFNESGTMLRIDTNMFFGFVNATSEDNGIENTDKIINHSYPRKLGATAAKKCRDYFYGMYVYNMSTQTSSTWYGNKGQWYLPSLKEAKYLAHAKEKINKIMESDSGLYTDPFRPSSVVTKINRYGWEPLANCYWTSTEFSAKMAYYQCVDGETLPKSYVPKNSFGFTLSIRPIRKVAL